MPPERLSRIVDQVNALVPDLILLGGDYVKGSPFGMGDIPAERAIAPLHGLRARLGVIAVLGNNDCADGQDDRIAGLLRTGGIRVLRNNVALRSEEHTSELQSLMRISYAVFCLTNK